MTDSRPSEFNGLMPRDTTAARLLQELDLFQELATKTSAAESDATNARLSTATAAIQRCPSCRLMLSLLRKTRS